MLLAIAHRFRVLADIADACAGRAEQIANDKTRHALVSASALRVCHGFDRIDYLGRRAAVAVHTVDVWLDILTMSPRP